jgi:5-methylcytosine-specific restriction protein A
MAKRALRVCKMKGCHNLTRNVSGYCDEHLKGYTKEKGNKTPDPLYVSSQWRKVRRLHLEEFPLCQRCMDQGRVTPATMVHHKQEVKAGGDPFATDNLESICLACHNVEHGATRGGVKSSERARSSYRR